MSTIGRSAAYPSKPRRLPLAEPSIPPLMLAAVAILGAHRAIPARLRRRMLLTGLSDGDIKPLLARIRSVHDWARVFDEASARHEADGAIRTASALAFLGQLILSPYNPAKPRLRERFRRCYVAHRAENVAVRFESLKLCDGTIAAIRETPLTRVCRATPIVLLPPLASTKEELTIFADYFLAHGYPVIRMDMPGQGDSIGPLTRDAEHSLARALAEMGYDQPGSVITGGVSLGAHFALRLAVLVQARALFGVSPPAITGPADWAHQPEIVYQYLDLYFSAATRAETYRICQGLTHEGCAVGDYTAPVWMFHAAKDPIARPNALERYRGVLASAQIKDRLYHGGHACLKYWDEIGSDVADWLDGLGLDSPGQ